MKGHHGVHLACLGHGASPHAAETGAPPPICCALDPQVPSCWIILEEGWGLGSN